jgi:hypothetical protein
MENVVLLVQSCPTSERDIFRPAVHPEDSDSVLRLNVGIKIYQTIRRHIAEDSNFASHCHEILKSHKSSVMHKAICLVFASFVPM